MKNLFRKSAIAVASMMIVMPAIAKDNIIKQDTVMKTEIKSQVPLVSPDCQHVKIPRGNFDLAADIYLPVDFDTSKRYPAIVVSHPGGGVKEQVAGTYAHDLSKAGFVTVAFDASYQGASGGEPRGVDSPFNRMADISYVIDYLDNIPYVDSDKIGALGICAGGGATIAAAPTEKRIKAAAGVSTFDVGAATRGVGPEAVNETLEKIAVQRENEAKGDPILSVPIIPDTKEQLPANAPEFLVEAVDYYRTPRGYHPHATNRATFTSQTDALRFYPWQDLGTMMTAPLLLIAGDKADTLPYSQAAYDADNGPKELYLIKGATHVDLYDKEPYVSEAVAKLSEFFSNNLK